jgi:hypothetical protein
MSRVSPKKGAKSSSPSKSVIVTSSISQMVKHSYDYEYVERLNATEVENVQLRTKVVSIEEKNAMIAQL